MTTESGNDFETSISRLRAEVGRWAAGGQGRPLDDILTDGYSLVLSLEGERLRTQAEVERLAGRDPLDAAGQQELTRLVRHELEVARRETDLRELLSDARARRRHIAAA